jgi:hypothetical protein
MRRCSRRERPVLRPGVGGNVALKAAHQKSLHSSVGFGQAPAAAYLSAANANVGIQSVAAGWAYQYAGSRFVQNSRSSMI